MPVSVAWHDDAKTIVRLDFHSTWTLAELGDAVRESRALITSIPRTVDVIWDAAEAGSVPRNVITHFLLNLEIVQVPANQGAVIVVAKSTLHASLPPPADNWNKKRDTYCGVSLLLSACSR